MSPAAKARIEASPDVPMTTTQGCPALAGVGGPNAIVALFGRISEAVADMQPSELPSAGAEDTPLPDLPDAVAHWARSGPNYPERLQEVQRVMEVWSEGLFFAAEVPEVAQAFAEDVARRLGVPSVDTPPASVRNLRAWLVHRAAESKKEVGVVLLTPKDGDRIQRMDRDQLQRCQEGKWVLVGPKELMVRLHPDQWDALNSGGMTHLFSPRTPRPEG